MNIFKLFVSFAIVSIIAAISALFTIVEVNELTNNTKKMYTHPFKVSNAIGNIQTSIITMHRNMKDVVLTKNSVELIKIIEDVQKEEEKVYRNFELVYKNYLGKKADIDASYKTFKNWKNIRDEVISLVYKNQLEKAVDITKDKGAKHIQNLYSQIDILKKFAFNKAEEYYNLSLQNSSLDKIIFAYIFAFFVAAVVVIYVVKNLLYINKYNKKQLYLIDQNILIAKFGLDKKVLEISNALCNSLNIKKEEVINTINDFFFTNEELYNKFENEIYSGKNYKDEVYILIEGEKCWFDIEIIPEFDENLTHIAFTVLFTNIADKKQIEKVSITDKLTGLHNRHYFEMIFDKEVKRAKREEKPLSIIMLDIDYFKQYNDTYGHQEGDLALEDVSGILSTYTNRPYDYVFRVGGEEFVIITYQEDFYKLKEFVSLIINEIESLKIKHENSKVSQYLTISAGVMQLGQENTLDTDEMYRKVDELLYEAKASGRNNFKGLYLD